MGKKSTPAAPAVPDYTGAAQAQGAANLTAAQQGSVLSNPNIVTPYGDYANKDQTCSSFVRSMASVNAFKCNLAPRDIRTFSGH